MVRIKLPYHLQNLAHVGAEIQIAVREPVTATTILDTLEAEYPMLLGTIRDQATGQRRPYLRYFASQEDHSLESPDTELPAAVAEGKEPFIVMTAIAGG